MLTSLLLVFGLVMSFSASFVEAATAGDPFGVFRRQATFAVLGTIAFAAAARMPHIWWRRLAWPMIATTLVALVLVLVPGIGIERFGSTRWIGVGPLAVQPTEFAKLAVVLWLGDVYERKRPRDGALHDVDHLLVPALPLLGLVGVLVMLQPDLGTAIILALIVGAVLWIEGLPARYLAVLAAVVGVAGLLLAVVAPYRLARIAGWLAPEEDPLGSGFQLLQSRYALGSGGIFGVGLGESRGKWNFVPNPETDFIFAIIGEELGLLGTLLVVVLFAMVLVFGYRVAFRVPDGFGRAVAFTITTWIVGQALINISTVTGLLPITGVTLPLVSVGGSSLFVTLAALGILVSMARTAPHSRRQSATAGKGSS
ncbi:MAG: putative lipid II flippase FtsW [Nitriliruptoraceae bacterium]